MQTTFFDYVWEKCLPHHWQSVDTLQNLRWKEMQLRLWKILAFSPGGKSTLTNIELYIWSVINSTWNGGPRWQSWTPALLIAPAVPVNKYFPIFLSSVCLSVSLLSLSPTKVSGGGGSFDYLCCRLIAFLNLCTDVLLHRPRACRTRPDGPLPGEKQTAPCFFLPTFSQLLTFILSFCLGCYRRHYQVYLLCLFS